ncbi:hypothetical protein NDU88_010584 [Pleurodeles waltl]|uniref:Cystatin LXN-type domain-containing protein n=1 Tax=Pleurodeles waltl TaxID=8319 RepID=A0AAV7Q0K2_PLEWA|nr:hypothetical protein NDU88_010584 [Pleurodeles waltl]
MEILPSHYRATRAASLVANYINYRQGAPHCVYQPDWVTEARRECANQSPRLKTSAAPRFVHYSSALKDLRLSNIKTNSQRQQNEMCRYEATQK